MVEPTKQVCQATGGPARTLDCVILQGINRGASERRKIPGELGQDLFTPYCGQSWSSQADHQDYVVPRIAPSRGMAMSQNMITPDSGFIQNTI
jgi:hypothetical protein